jgi:hypothetical protein
MTRTGEATIAQMVAADFGSPHGDTKQVFEHPEHE